MNPEPSHETQTKGQGLLMVAAKALQSFVLGSDKLREMVGATQLIEDFCTRAFSEDFLMHCGIQGYSIITAAAGQTTIRFDRYADAERAAALWPWAAHCHAPGMEIHVSVRPLSSAMGGYVAAIDEIQVELAQSRNSTQFLDLPFAPPPAMRAPRSGKVAVAYETFAKQTEAVDAEASAKRGRRKLIRQDQRIGETEHPMFTAFGFDPEKVGPDLNSLAAVPLNLRDFRDASGIPETFSARQSSLAIIHADGNGLGQAFIDLANGLRACYNPEAMKCISAFSEGFRQVSLDASKAAMEHLRTIFEEPLPVLPIVLAGDDLTVITRGEIAISFAEAWLVAFELETEKVLAKLKTDLPVVAQNVKAGSFSAGAGVLFFTRSHPVLDVYHRCEELASFAKGEAKKMANPGCVAPGSLAFHRLQGGDDSERLSNGVVSYQLGGMPYFLGKHAGSLRPLGQLRELRSALADLPSGSKRQLLAEMRQHPAAAQAFLDRVLNVRRGRQKGDDVCARIEAALISLHGESGGVWAPGNDVKNHWSAIPDAVQWAAAEPEFPTETILTHEV